MEGDREERHRSLESNQGLWVNNTCTYESYGKMGRVMDIDWGRYS